MMWSHRMPLARFGSVVAVLCFAGSAQAQGFGYGYTSSYGAYEARTYGFAEPALRGDYIGAPFTRTPRPSDLVPSVWGYGTYGVPTMTGIRSAPVGVPTVYVIDGPPRAARRSSRRDAQWSRMEVEDQPMRERAGGARVIQVTVPRR